MLRSSISVTLVTILVGAISFLNQVVIARLFGASIQFDAYLVALSLPILASTVVNSAFSYAVVPTLVRRIGVETSYKRFASQMLICASASAALLAGVGSFSSPAIARIMGAEFPVEVQVDIVRMARISWATAGLVVVTSFLNAMQIASKRFVLPTLVAMLPYLGMIVLGLLEGHNMGPLAIVWGMFIGYVASIFVLLAASRRDLYIRGTGLGDWYAIREFYAQLPLAMVAMLIFSVHQFIDAYWAPKLGEAALSYLGYSQRLLIAIGALMIAGPSAVLVPRITQVLLEGRQEQFLFYCLRVVRTVLIFGAFVGVIVSVLAIPTVEILFQRGAFNDKATEGVASLLPLMMMGMTAMLGVVIMFRALFSVPNVSAGATLGILASVLYFALSGLLSHTFGLIGIAAAYAISWWLTLVVAFTYLWKGRLGLLNTRVNRAFVPKLLITISCVGIATHWAAVLLIRPMEVVGSLSLLARGMAVCAVSGAVFYLVAARVLGIPEARRVFDICFRKRRLSTPLLKP